MAPIISWNRFNTPNLIIKAELVAASHTFMFESRQTQIALPPAKETSKETASNPEPRYEVMSLRTADGIPLTFEVEDVEVHTVQPPSKEISEAIARYQAGDKSS